MRRVQNSYETHTRCNTGLMATPDYLLLAYLPPESLLESVISMC